MINWFYFTPFSQVAGLRELIEGILPYTERHFSRIDRLFRSTFLLDYTLSSMSILNPLEVKEEINFNAPTVEGDEKSSHFSTGIGRNDDGDITDVKDNGSTETCEKILKNPSARNKKRKKSTVVEVSSLLPSDVALAKKKHKRKG